MALKSKPVEKVRTDVPVEVAAQELQVRVNLNVPVSMRNHWKAEAARQGRSMADLIVDAVNEYLSKNS
jgi:hypothetical protein